MEGKWTTTPPAESGWYWRKDRYDAAVVRLSVDGNGLLTCETPRRDGGPCVWWSLPVEMPERRAAVDVVARLVEPAPAPVPNPINMIESGVRELLERTRDVDAFRRSMRKALK